VILMLLLYIYACLAVWHYAAQAPEAFRHDRAYAFAAMVFCVAVILLSGEKMLAWTAAAVFLTYPLYPLCRGGRKTA